MDAPTGSLALVFTDIESSTLHWERHPDVFRGVLDAHDRVLRTAIAEHRGYEVKTEGDAFMVAFARARDAARFCLAVQRELQAAVWPDAFAGADAFRGPRVRMGVHTGEPICRPDPVTGRMDYFGPVVNRAARVAAAAHGGQVLLSADALALVGPLDSAVLDDLGEHALKGIEGTLRLVQVLPEELASRAFPAPRTVSPRRSNLPAQVTGLVGRAAELAATADALGASRLVTLLGTAGTGKTRLAQRAAGERLPDLAGGAWWCDLQAVDDAAGIARALAAALSVPLAEVDPVRQLGRALADRGPVLVVFDGFEPLLAHAPSTVGAWLAAVPELRVLATSREPLGLPGERLVDVPPLPHDDAVALFVERARAVRPDLPDDAATSAAIARVVDELDGLPLALELAAARVRSLTPAALLGRLDRRLDLLRAPGTRGDRQATLRGAIDGSWELMEAWEQAALAQLSVFRGPFSLDAAEAVVDLDPWPEAPWTVDVVTRLHERSLVRASPDGRFGMLSSIRAYAAEKLLDATGAVARHGGWFAGLEQAAEARDLADLLAARERAVDRADAEVASGALLGAIAVLRGRGPADIPGLTVPVLALPVARRAEVLARAGGAVVMADPTFARAVLEEALSIDAPAGIIALARMYLADLERLAGRPDAAEWLLRAAMGVADREVRAGSVRRLGLVLVETGRLDAAETAFAESLALCRDAGDRTGEASALGNLAIIHMERGRPAEALAALEDAIALHHALGSTMDEAVALQNRANLLIELARYDEAKAGYEVALAMHRAIGSRRFEGAALCNLGVLHAVCGGFEEALACVAAALPIVREAGDRRFEGIAVGVRAEVRTQQGDLTAAWADALAARAVAAEIHDRRFEVVNDARLGAIALLDGRLDHARERLDAAAAAFESLGDPQNLAVVESDLSRLALLEGDAHGALELAERAEGRLRPRMLAVDLIAALVAKAEALGALDRVATGVVDEAIALAASVALSPRLLTARRLDAVVALR